MIDRAKETGVRDGGSFQLNRDETSERWVEDRTRKGRPLDARNKKKK